MNQREQYDAHDAATAPKSATSAARKARRCFFDFALHRIAEEIAAADLVAANFARSEAAKKARAHQKQMKQARGQ